MVVSRGVKKTTFLGFFFAVLLIVVTANPASATVWEEGTIVSGDFTYLGTPTAWLPGANTAYFHGFTAPAGPAAPGAASWSVMPAGTLTDTFDPHSGAGTPTVGGGAGTVMVGAGTGTELTVYSSMLGVWAAASGFTSLGMVADGGATFNTSEPGPGNTLFGDIRIGTIGFDGAGGTLAHAFQPGTSATFGGTPTIGGDAHFDTGETWADLVLGGPGGAFDYPSVVLHEFGHSLGLDHSEDSSAVMYPSISPGVVKRTLAADDIAGIQALYGVPEPCTLLLASIGLLGLAGRRRRI